MLKHTAIILLLLFSWCFNSSAQKENNPSSFSKQNFINTIKLFSNEILLVDKNSLEKHFNFPIKNENIWFVSGAPDSIFLNEETHIIPDFTIQDFRKYYQQIFLNPDSGFQHLFENINIDSLNYKTELHREIHFENDICFYIYEISLNDLSNEIEFSFGTNSNNKLMTDEFWCAEYLFTWKFKLINNVLVFQNLRIAG